MECESYAVEAARLRMLDRMRQVVGRGHRPTAPPMLEPTAVASEACATPRTSFELERIAIGFRHDPVPRRLSELLEPAGPAPSELWPFSPRPEVKPPLALSNHACRLGASQTNLIQIPLCRPAEPDAVDQQNPFQAGGVSPAELEARGGAGVPDPVGPGITIESRSQPPAKCKVQPIGPRLSFELPGVAS